MTRINNLLRFLIALIFSTDVLCNHLDRHLEMTSNTFKIVQLSDIYVDRVGVDFLRTEALFENLVLHDKPDLVILVGDTISPDDGDTEVEWAARFHALLDFLKEQEIPWVSSGGRTHPKVSRDQMVSIDKEYGGDLSWTGYRWDTNDLTSNLGLQNIGKFTARIPVVDPKSKKELFSVFVMDSESWSDCNQNGLTGSGCVSVDAVDWFANQQQKYTHDFNKRDMVFMHNPIQEFMALTNHYDVKGHREHPVGCQAVNTGLFGVAKSYGKVGWFSAGSDSNNDFVGEYHGVKLAYGRKTGRGGFRSLKQGARVFHINKKDHKAHVDMNYISFIIDEKGYKNVDMHVHPPPEFNFVRQLACSIDHFAQILNVPIAQD